MRQEQGREEEDGRRAEQVVKKGEGAKREKREKAERGSWREIKRHKFKKG